MKVSLYTLTSSLHDQNAVDAVSLDFIQGVEKALGFSLEFKGDDFSHYGESDLDLIFIRTGGSEGLFKKVYPRLNGKIILLTSGKSNSLAASLEILSFLNLNGRQGEVLHGSFEYIAHRIEVLAKVSKAKKSLSGINIGIIGEPSDWLIASQVDEFALKNKLGINVKRIPISELVDGFKRLDFSEAYVLSLAQASGEAAAKLASDYEENKLPELVRKYVLGALKIYYVLKSIIEFNDLSGITLRCFDLLDSLGNTGCLALALLNSEGIPSSCEGDTPALISMLIGNALTGQSGFQCNPSQIDPQSGKVLLAHCTVPFNMINSYSYNTHFESGIGLAIHGELPQGKVTMFKVSGDLSRAFCENAQLLENQYGANLCRTQILLKLEDASLCSEYFLKNPIGNHHIVFNSDYKELFEAFLLDPFFA